MTESPLGSPAAGEPGPHHNPPPGHDLVGTVLADRYRILRLLGEGAMGVVLLGQHLRIDRRDAIKVLQARLAADADARARFLRGARNAAAIRHPHVCTIYDYTDADDGTPFLAMEFIEGESLKDLLDREGALPVERAAAIAAQVADALGAAHQAGVVHRDLKPANIMLAGGAPGDEVRVVDFDIAISADRPEEVTQDGNVIGTPEYMSPEQLTADRLDGRSDLYSLGVVLFRMLTGTLPFPGGNSPEALVSRLRHPPLTLAEARPDLTFPPPLQQVLDRVLTVQPGERYVDAFRFRDR